MTALDDDLDDTEIVPVELIKMRSVLEGVRFRLSLGLVLALWIAIEISVLTWHIVGGVFWRV